MKRSEAGQGGKKGHSNMTHWDYTKVVKNVSRKIRRANDKLAIKED